MGLHIIDINAWARPFSDRTQRTRMVRAYARDRDRTAQNLTQPPRVYDPDPKYMRDGFSPLVIVTTWSVASKNSNSHIVKLGKGYYRGGRLRRVR